MPHSLRRKVVVGGGLMRGVERGQLRWVVGVVGRVVGEVVEEDTKSLRREVENGDDERVLRVRWK